MDAESQAHTPPSITGHMIDLGAGHLIAMYQRDGVGWVAEFRDGRGEFTYASAWFRLYPGSLRYFHNHRAALRSATDLTPEMLESIERLHRDEEARDERTLAVFRSVVAAGLRCWIGVSSRLREGVSKIAAW